MDFKVSSCSLPDLINQGADAILVTDSQNHLRIYDYQQTTHLFIIESPKLEFSKRNLKITGFVRNGNGGAYREVGLFLV